MVAEPRSCRYLPVHGVRRFDGAPTSWYWTRQWGVIDPRVDPLSFEEDGAGRVTVKVHLVVRDLQGPVIADRMVRHAYEFEDAKKHLHQWVLYSFILEKAFSSR